MYKKILIPAKLERVPTGQFVVDTDAVYDKLIHKSLEEINLITTSRLETLENELEVPNKGSLSVNLIARTNEEENNHQEDLIGATITLSSNLDVIREATYNGEPVLFEDLDLGNYTITVSERDFGSHNEKNYATPSPENITILPGNLSNATLIYDLYKYTISIGGDNLPPDTTVVNINVKPTVTYSFTFGTLRSNPVYTTHKLSEKHFTYTKEFPYLGIDGNPDSNNKDVFHVETTINNYLVIITYTQETLEYSFVVRKEYKDETTNEQMFDYESEIFENKIFKIILLGDREEQTTDILEINWYSKIKGGETTVVYNSVLEDHLPCLKFVHKRNRKYLLVYPPISGYTGTSMKQNNITTSDGDIISYTENVIPKAQITVNVDLVNLDQSNLNFNNTDNIAVYLKNTITNDTVYQSLNITSNNVIFNNVEYGDYIVYIPTTIRTKGYEIIEEENLITTENEFLKSITVDSDKSIDFHFLTDEYNVVVTGTNKGSLVYSLKTYANGSKVRILPSIKFNDLLDRLDFSDVASYTAGISINGYTITVDYVLLSGINLRLKYYINNILVNPGNLFTTLKILKKGENNEFIQVAQCGNDTMDNQNNELIKRISLEFGTYKVTMDLDDHYSPEYNTDTEYVLDSTNISEEIIINYKSDEYTLCPYKDGILDSSLTFNYPYGGVQSSIQNPYKLIVAEGTAINSILDALRAGAPNINGYNSPLIEISSTNSKEIRITYSSTSETLNIYAYYSDGSTSSAANANSSAIGIGVDTENGTYLILKTRYTCSNPYTLLTNEQYAAIRNTKYRHDYYSEYASLDMNGYLNTVNILTVFKPLDNLIIENIPFKKADTVIERGFIGTAGEWILLMQNYYEIKQVAVAIGMLRSMEDTDMDFIGITSTLEDNKNNCITVSYNGVGENPAIGYASTDLTYYILKKLS